MAVSQGGAVRSWIHLTNRTPKQSEVSGSLSDFGCEESEERFREQIESRIGGVPVTYNNGRMVRKEAVYPQNGEMVPVDMNFALNRFDEYLDEKEDMETIMVNTDTGDKSYFSNSHRFEEDYKKKQMAEFYAVESKALENYGEEGLTTVMLTLSASPFDSTGQLIPSIDHLDSIMCPEVGSWQAVKTAMSRALSDYDSEYLRILEPHTPDKGQYVSAGYAHVHVGILVDDPENELCSDDFAPVMRAHVNNCETAGESAHNVHSDAVSVTPYDPEEDGGIGAYLTAYMGEMLEDDPQDAERWYKRFMVTLWASNRRRVSFSRGAKEWAREDYREKYMLEEGEEEEEEESAWEMWGVRVVNCWGEREEIECGSGGGGSYLRAVDYDDSKLKVDVPQGRGPPI